MFLANLSGADLLNATGPPSSVESAACDINTNLTGTLFDQVAAGWAFVPARDQRSSGRIPIPKAAVLRPSFDSPRMLSGRVCRPSFDSLDVGLNRKSLTSLRVGLLLLLVFTIALVSPAAAQDVDGDTIDDINDNCINVANPNQKNSDFDAFGNVCDGDLNNDGTTDAVDLAILDAEILDPEPVQVADFNGDWVVDALDEAYFNTNLLNLAPGPAGSLAHDSDGNGVLDYCTPAPDHAPFANQWSPLLHPNLLVNGTLVSTLGDEPDGWDPLDSDVDQVAYRTDIAATGAYQILPFGGFGGISSGDCYNTCVAPAQVAVDSERAYSFSFLTCAGDFPPSVSWVTFDEFDAGGTSIGSVNPIGGSKGMSSGTGQWEETNVFYEPSSDLVASVRPRLSRKQGPDNGNSTFFATDFAFWQLDLEGNRTYRHPPSAKQAFEGARTRVDAYGNVEVLNLTTLLFEPFFPIGVYGGWQRSDFSFYADMGFNTYMNAFGVNLAAPLAVSAGMRLMVNTAALWDPNSYPNVDLVLRALAVYARDPTGTFVPVYDSLLGFHTDNEVFAMCLEVGDDCVAPYLSPWNGWVEPQLGITTSGPYQDLYAFDRAQNAGSRGVPNYFLNGNPNVSRAFGSSGGSRVNTEGDFRMDVSGSYGINGFEQIQMSDNQSAPGVFIQIQAHLANRFITTAWGGIARGARGIATWKDQISNAYFLRSPILRICGTTLPTFVERLTLENPVSGTIVEGMTSQAQAEILEDAGDYTGCPGTEIGRSYRFKLQANGVLENFFTLEEPLVEPVSGTPLGDARIVEVTGDYEVIHLGSLDQYAWASALGDFRDDVAALNFMLVKNHETSWTANCSATLANVVGNPTTKFGDNGITCGTRTDGDRGYLIVSNTYFDIDPFAPYLQQHVGETQDVDITLSNVPFALNNRRAYDFETNLFGSPNAVVGDAFSITLAPFEVAIIELPEPLVELTLAVGSLGLLSMGRLRRVPRQ